MRGSASVAYKKYGRTPVRVSDDEALENLVEGLKTPKKAYIYHCQNHYMCPIGFEKVPLAAKKGTFLTSIIIGEISPLYPCLQVAKWSDIASDMNCRFPDFFDIRNADLGV